MATGRLFAKPDSSVEPKVMAQSQAAETAAREAAEKAARQAAEKAKRDAASIGKYDEAELRARIEAIEAKKAADKAAAETKRKAAAAAAEKTHLIAQIAAMEATREAKREAKKADKLAAAPAAATARSAARADEQPTPVESNGGAGASPVVHAAAAAPAAATAPAVDAATPAAAAKQPNSVKKKSPKGKVAKAKVGGGETKVVENPVPVLIQGKGAQLLEVEKREKVYEKRVAAGTTAPLQLCESCEVQCTAAWNCTSCYRNCCAECTHAQPSIRRIDGLDADASSDHARLLQQLQRDSCSAREMDLFERYKYSADMQSICDLQVGDDGFGWRCPFDCEADGCAATGDAILDGMAAVFALSQKKNSKNHKDMIKEYDKRALALRRKRSKEQKTQRKEADGDGADAPAAGSGSAPSAKAPTGRDYEDQRLANIQRNEEKLAKLDMEREKQQLRQCKEGQTAGSTKGKTRHVATTAAGAAMTTRLTASEAEADAVAQAAAAFDATISTRFKVHARDVVRSNVKLPGIDGFVHYKKVGVLVQGVQIADSSFMPKGQVCGVLVSDDLEEGFIIVWPSTEGDIYLQSVDLLLVQNEKGLVDVHGAPAFLNDKLMKRHIAVVKNGWNKWCISGAKLQREAFDARYKDGVMLQSIHKIESWSIVDGKILIHVKITNPRLAAQAQIQATAEVMQLPVVEKWVRQAKKRKAAGLQEAVHVAAQQERESAANSESDVLAQTGAAYGAAGHRRAFDAWIADEARNNKNRTSFDGSLLLALRRVWRVGDTFRGGVGAWNDLAKECLRKIVRREKGESKSYMDSQFWQPIWVEMWGAGHHFVTPNAVGSAWRRLLEREKAGIFNAKVAAAEAAKKKKKKKEDKPDAAVAKKRKVAAAAPSSTKGSGKAAAAKKRKVAVAAASASARIRTKGSGAAVGVAVAPSSTKASDKTKVAAAATAGLRRQRRMRPPQVPPKSGGGSKRGVAVGVLKTSQGPAAAKSRKTVTFVTAQTAAGRRTVVVAGPAPAAAALAGTAVGHKRSHDDAGPSKEDKNKIRRERDRTKKKAEEDAATAEKAAAVAAAAAAAADQKAKRDVAAANKRTTKAMAALLVSQNQAKIAAVAVAAERKKAKDAERRVAAAVKKAKQDVAARKRREKAAAAAKSAVAAATAADAAAALAAAAPAAAAPAAATPAAAAPPAAAPAAAAPPAAAPAAAAPPAAAAAPPAATLAAPPAAPVAAPPAAPAAAAAAAGVVVTPGRMHAPAAPGAEAAAAALAAAASAAAGGDGGGEASSVHGSHRPLVRTIWPVTPVSREDMMRIIQLAPNSVLSSENRRRRRTSTERRHGREFDGSTSGGTGGGGWGDTGGGGWGDTSGGAGGGWGGGTGGGGCGGGTGGWGGGTGGGGTGGGYGGEMPAAVFQAMMQAFMMQGLRRSPQGSPQRMGGAVTLRCASHNSPPASLCGPIPHPTPS